jgi:transcriptional regulator with XRE-family HTH domain
MAEITGTVTEVIARRVRRLRRDQDLSQEEVAERAEIHRTQMTLIERAERLPRIDTMIRLAGALGVSPAELLDGLVWRPGIHSPGRLIVPERDPRRG